MHNRHNIYQSLQWKTPIFWKWKEISEGPTVFASLSKNGDGGFPSKTLSPSDFSWDMDICLICNFIILRDNDKDSKIRNL